MGTVEAQEGLSDSVMAETFAFKARAFQTATKFDSAIHWYQKAAALYEQVEIWDEHVAMLISIGHINRRRGAWEDAQEAYQLSIDKAHQVLPENSFQLALAYGGMGRLNLSLGNYRKALESYDASRKVKEAQSVPDSISLATSYTNMGLCSFRLARFDEAVQHYEKAVALLKAMGREKSRTMGTIYRGLGLIYQDKGDYILAKEYLDRCVDIRKKSYNPNHYMVAGSYLDVGNLFFLQNKLDEAQQYFQLAMDTYIEGSGKDFPQIAWAHLNMGLVLQEKQELEAGREALFTALQIFEDKYGSEYSGTALSYFHLGQLLSDQGQYKESLAYLDRARKVYEDLHGPNSSLVIETYHGIGNVHRLAGEHDQALKVFSYAQTIMEDNLAHTRHLPVMMLFVLRDQGRTYAGRFEDSQNIKDLEYALESFNQVHAWMDSLRSGFSYDNSKIFLQETFRVVFEEAISVCVKLQELSGEDHYLREAFAMSERSKAALLLETVRASGARNRAGIPDQVFQEEKNLKTQLAFSEQQLYEEQSLGAQADTLRLAEMQEELFSLRRQYEELLLELQQRYPHYYQPEIDNEVTDVLALQARLKHSQDHLIEYFMGDKNLFIFLISADKIQVFQEEAEEGMHSEIRSFLRDVSNPYMADEGHREDLKAMARHGHAWYNLLLARPLAELGKIDSQLVIVPDGILGYLPFEMLVQTPIENPASYHDLDYVLNDFMIRYAYSATLLMEGDIDQDRRRRTAFSGFAPEYGSEAGQSMTLQIAAQSQDNFPELLFNQPEVSAIANLTGGQAFLGKKATEGAFKRHAPYSRVLHIAAHAFLDDRDPLYSGMVFSREKQNIMGGEARGIGPELKGDSLGEQGEDGFLYAFELYNMQLEAELAVLSACNTGIGQISRGEGVMSLSRAFRQAGCPNLIMSLWQADDQAAFDLMESFYRNLKAGMGKAAALRQAKLEYLATHDTGHPQYWASFVLIGDNLDVKIRKGLPFWLIMGLALVLMAGFAYYRNKRLL